MPAQQPAPAKKQGSGKKPIVIIAAVVAVLAALAIIGMVTGIIGPGGIGGQASAHTVTASSATHIVPNDASGTRIIEYKATLHDDTGTAVAEIDVVGDGGFTMNDFAYADLKKGSYTITIVSNGTTYPDLPVNYDPENEKAPAVVEPVPPADSGKTDWTVPSDPQKEPESPEEAEEKRMYAEYSRKVEELLGSNGPGMVSNLSNPTGVQCASGVFLVRLVDFDRDGTDELMVGYYDGSFDASTQSYPEADRYKLVIFGWNNGAVVEYARLTAEHTNGGFAFYTLYEGANKTYVSNVTYNTMAGGGYDQIYELGSLTDGVFKTESSYGYYGVYTQNTYTEVNGVRVDSTDRNAVSNELKKSIGEHTRVVYWCIYSTNTSIEQGTAVTVVRPEDMIAEANDTIYFLRSNVSGNEGSTSETVIVNKAALKAEAFGPFPRDFTFSSGAGAWSTQITIQPDGTFTGSFRDSDMGDTGSGYPGGKMYCTDFHGSFSVVGKVSDYEYLLSLDSLVIDNAAEEKVVNQVLQVWRNDSAYGLGVPSDQPQGEWHLYLPGRSTSDLSAAFLGWTFARNISVLDYYALDDRANGNGWRSEV